MSSDSWPAIKWQIVPLFLCQSYYFPHMQIYSCFTFSQVCLLLLRWETYLKTAPKNVSIRKYFTECRYFLWKCHVQWENWGPERRATHTGIFQPSWDWTLNQAFLSMTPSPHPTPLFFFSFSGYTYKLPRVLDNTSIFQLFSSSHDFPMKILLFPLSDVTRGPQAGLINWSLWHLKRQSSPGRRMACDCSVPSYCIPTSPASPSRAKRQAIGNSCWGKDFCM